MIGRALNGRYVLEEILGVGGMATVYRGHDRVLGRPVAVKVLNGGLADDPHFAERFGREAQHAAMLVHPRIVMVFDSGVDQGSPYIVMELVHGRSLSRLLAETPGLPVERAVGIAAAVCEALEVAHAAGLVHRDIKPGNIMITPDGGVKVVDFGIARVSSSSSRLTQPATVLGTAAYLSPEQATAAEVDGRADLYAVGCVLVEMLTGEPPFTADAPVAIAFKHVSEQPAPVSARRPDVPAGLDAAVLRLLAKNPAERPADAGSARAELLAAVPVAAATDRTTELLAATQALPPIAAPPAGPYADPQRTSVLPPLAPLPPSFGPQTSMPHTSMMEPIRPDRRRPLVLAGVGVAVVAGAAAIAAFALSGPGGGARAGVSTPTVAASASASPSASESPSTLPTPTAKPGPAGALAALRAAVAQAQITKERDRQADLLGLLDDASGALADHQPQVAEQTLRNAQKVVRDLAKKHAIDNGTSQNWQNRLGSLINTLHAQQPTRDSNAGN
ncbi:hypothetical protein GCM10010193_31410 [Kitasatospora atroaurantiaca]|uniref:non-specific serine/threonine protein kinase n=1 Tax=Kitasatospora atroaurantiaca TaxID=285545 RepID=A0A561ER92_9ACTN|nr:protein kinase [Kitasatospora atroaurantiaca]TWE18127.1 serine/threonine-protein kinase [Kitasatospora atroaurantiaca]